MPGRFSFLAVNLPEIHYCQLNNRLTQEVGRDLAALARHDSREALGALLRYVGGCIHPLVEVTLNDTRVFTPRQQDRLDAMRFETVDGTPVLPPDPDIVPVQTVVRLQQRETFLQAVKNSIPEARPVLSFYTTPPDLARWL